MHGFPMHKHKPTCALYTSCPTYTHTHAQPTVYNPDKIVERESHHVLYFIGVPPYSSFFSGSLNATSLFCSLPRGYVQLNTGWCNCKVGLAMVSLPSSRPGFIWLNYFDYFCPLKLDVQLALFIGSRSPSSSNPWDFTLGNSKFLTDPRTGSSLVGQCQMESLCAYMSECVVSRLPL